MNDGQSVFLQLIGSLPDREFVVVSLVTAETGDCRISPAGTSI